MAATDSIGLEHIRVAGALKCHQERMAAIVNGELALSRAVLDAGFNIAALVARYQARGQGTWGNCA